MLGELIGLGLLGLAAHLAKRLPGQPLSRDPDDEELYEVFMERLGWLDVESEWVQVWRHFLEDGGDPINPCALRQRQSLLRAKDALDELRGVTRHPKFNPKALLKGCMDGFPEGSPEALTRNSCSEVIDEARDELNSIMGDMADYERVLKSECPSVWTEKQGLEDIRLAVKGNPRQAMVAAIKRGIPFKLLRDKRARMKKLGFNESFLDVPNEYFENVVRWFAENPEVVSADPIDSSPFPPGTLLYHSEPKDDE